MNRTEPLRRARPVLAAVALAAAVLAGCGTAAEDPAPATSEDATTPEGQRSPATGTTGQVTVTETSVILGDPDAAQRVHVYQDLSCPHCRQLHAVMATDVADWAAGADVAVEFTVVDYLGPRTTHAFSTRGANLLALVADVDPEAWPAVQEALLEMQPTSTTVEVSDEQLVTVAREAGAELDDHDLAAVEHLAYADWVAAATERAAAAGISYIPQVWIGGELVEGASHEETAELVRQAVGG